MPRLLMYRSAIEPKFLVDQRIFQVCLGDIQTVAKQRNLSLGVNGVLVVDNGHFIQILEGDKVAVEHLLTSIRADTRHANLQVLIDQSVRSRTFISWNMEVFILDGQPSIPLTKLKNFRDSYLSIEKPRGKELARWVKRLIAHPEIRFQGTD